MYIFNSQVFKYTQKTLFLYNYFFFFYIELRLVWTSILSSPNEQYIMNESTLRFKLKYNIRF